MRSLIQLVIPALIVIGMVYWMTRRRSGAGRQSDKDSDKGTFILILVVGALVAVGVVFVLFGEAGP